MIDVHVHFLDNATGEYTFELLDNIAASALKAGMEEIYLLEHTHLFREFKQVYEPIANYNQYQSDWLSRKMGGSIEKYLKFIDEAKRKVYPIRIRFGLEVCYIPQTENLLSDILNQYDFDFFTGSVHYIENWGFDHKAEFWEGVDVDRAYRRYYEIMANLIETGLFDGLAHPDSIKCFQCYPSYDLRDTYEKIAILLNRTNMYVEQSGGLALNYGSPELGMNPVMLRVFRQNAVRILTASDAHKPQHAGANIYELQQAVRNA